jgi:colanic acid biosynthesis glycosyl transferase WcaI
MRILFFSDHFRPEPSAPAAHVFERARLWAQAGHAVTVLTSAPNFPEGRVYPGYKNHWRFVEHLDGIRVVRVKTFITRNEGFVLRTVDYASYTLSSLFFALFEERPDVVISTSPPLFVPVAAVAYARLCGIPHVFEIRDLWPASILATNSIKRGRIYDALERLELGLYRSSARVLAMTHSFVQDLTARGVPAEKIDVVINGTNLELFSPRPRDREIEEQFGLHGRFVVGYLGTIGLAHGLDNVIETALLLRESPVTFFFVGVGAAKEHLQRRTRELGLQNVVFAPRQLKEDMPRFWSVCDLGLIHLRNDELFSTVIPSKIFESMAMGIPVLYVGPRGEGPDIVERYDAGVVVPPDDPARFAAAVQQLAADAPRRERLAANARAAAPSFSRERHAEATLAVLENAVGQPSCVWSS